jgi:hypothetical protein
MAFPFTPYHGSGFKQLKVKCRKVEVSINLGVSREKNLKSSVENESVNVVASYAATHCVGGFKENRRDSVLF